jgi:hypothetical protein
MADGDAWARAGAARVVEAATAALAVHTELCVASRGARTGERVDALASASALLYELTCAPGAAAKESAVRAARAGAARVLPLAAGVLQREGRARFVAPGEAMLMRYNRELLAALARHACAGCGAADAPRLRRCGRCQAVRYCDAECQRQHWATHKEACRPRHEAEE